MSYACTLMLLGTGENVSLDEEGEYTVRSDREDTEPTEDQGQQFNRCGFKVCINPPVRLQCLETN